MIRVMSFNLRTAEANDGENSWEQRREMALGRVRAFAPDLLGLQECHDVQQSLDVKAELSDFAFIGVRRGGSGRAPLEMTPALVRQAGFDVLDQRIFWLSRTPDVPASSSWASAYVRTAVQLRLRERGSGRELAWMHTHFDYTPLAVPESAKLLRRELEALPQGLPLLVTGDFNAGKRSGAYRTLLGAGGSRPLRDAYRLAHPDGRGDGSFHAFGKLPRAQAIDWILVSDEFRVRDAGIDRSQVDGRYPSDHFPIWALLDLD
jgi:endonuclease/exonuclease/phosphatase family metal-dependent hydrolase